MVINFDTIIVSVYSDQSTFIDQALYLNELTLFLFLSPPKARGQLLIQVRGCAKRVVLVHEAEKGIAELARPTSICVLVRARRIILGLLMCTGLSNR